jgi:hypothetical protein
MLPGSQTLAACPAILLSLPQPLEIFLRNQSAVCVPFHHKEATCRGILNESIYSGTWKHALSQWQAAASLRHPTDVN